MNAIGIPTLHAQAARLEPRPHQVEAVDAVATALSVHDRAQLVMACATGKTAAGLWIAENLVGRNPGVLLCLFPSLALIRQTLAVWQANHSWGLRFRFLAICSDRTVVDDDELPEDMPFAVTTKSEVIAAFLTSSARPDAVSVLFATYHSSNVVAEALAGTGITIDLTLLDEAHRTAGDEDGMFALALDNAAIPSRLRLFKTATPRLTRRRDHGEDSVTLSMDDEAVYGPVAYRLSFREAVKRGLICPYKVLVSTVTLSELGAKPGDTKVLMGGRQMTIADAANRVALAKAVAKVGARKIITFHNSVADAARFAEGRAGIGALLTDFDVVHVNGALPGAVRNELMTRFAMAEYGLATNARCLTEGIDVPAVDLVAFMGRKTSRIDIVQAVGRALRKPEGEPKDVGYVLVPLLLDTESGEDVEEAVRRARLDVLWDVLTSLMDEDEQLTETLIAGLRERDDWAEYGLSVFRDYLEVIGDAQLDAVRRAIDVFAVDELVPSFHYGLGKLHQFVAREGHARVPWNHIEDGFPLGYWVTNRRSDYKKKRLRPDRIAALEALPGWTWDMQETKKFMRVEALIAFSLREGHVQVPKGHVENGLRLDTVITNWRTNYSLGRLQADMITVLEAVPGWSWDKPNSRLLKFCEIYRHFVEREGHGRVPKNHVEGNCPLGEKVFYYRRRHALEKLGRSDTMMLGNLPDWCWRSFDAKFNDGCAAYMHFFKREGHWNFPKGHRESGINLQGWVTKRRREYKAGKLSAGRITALEALPGWVWSVKEGDQE